MSACRSCEAPIVWAATSTGKRIPLDEKPTLDGTFVFVGGLARQVTADDRRLHRPTYTSHFATCPDGANWRRAR